MKSFVFMLIISGAMLTGQSQAQECDSGQCRMPVRSAVAAVKHVVHETAHAGVAVTKKVVSAPKKVAHRVRQVAWRLRTCCCCR